jgi:NTP pyrophosphatase (non-canonical NTP hydrolase)
LAPLLVSTQIKSRKHENLDKSEVKDEVGKEVADCIIALLSLANDFDIDIEKYVGEKMRKHCEWNKLD